MPTPNGSTWPSMLMMLSTLMCAQAPAPEDTSANPTLDLPSASAGHQTPAILVERIFPNQLAVDRLAAEQGRKSTGQPWGGVARVGQEIIARSTNGEQALTPLLVQKPVASGSHGNVGESTLDLPALALPSQVDNSAEPWFPEIRNQGSLGSCSAFSPIYYVLSSHRARMRGLNLRGLTGAELDPFVLSPAFTFNQTFSQYQSITTTLGVPTWNDFPYDGKSYDKLPINATVWRNALSNKSGSLITLRLHGTNVVDMDNALPFTTEMVNTLKQGLANGTLFNFVTPIERWTIRSLKSTSDPRADNSFAGQKVVAAGNLMTSHSMAIVGYNDRIWFDANNNNQVENSELGAWKIANSWGKSWGNQGFIWVPYSVAQQSVFRYGEVTTLSALPTYTPALIGEITVTASDRFNVRMLIGSIAPQGLALTNGVRFSGGITKLGYDFDAYQSRRSFLGTTQAVSATVAWDFSEQAENGVKRRWVVQVPRRYTTTYLGSDPTTITANSGVSYANFRLTDAQGRVLAATTTPVTAQVTENGGYTVVDVEEWRIEYTPQPSLEPGIRTIILAASTADDELSPEVTIDTTPPQSQRPEAGREAIFDGLQQDRDHRLDFLTVPDGQG